MTATALIAATAPLTARAATCAPIPAPPRVAVVTLARGRSEHLRRQAAAVAALDPPPCAYVVLSLDPEPPQVPGAEVLHRPIADGAPLPLAAARNQAIARVADADLVLCLDVDCLPEPDLLARLADAALRVGRPAVLAGPVGRLGPITASVVPAAALARARAAARRGPRPVGAAGELVDEPRVELFWSLAFAVAPATHARIGGFDEAYVGYGAEDTDYAFRFRRAGVPLIWVGGAWAHHQHHPVSSPPVEHLEAIVENARCFRERWGCWPMEGWLREFAARDLVAWDPDGDELRRLPPPATDATAEPPVA